MITVDTMIRRAAELTNVTVAQLYGPSHRRHICAVRSAVYIVMRERGLSFCQIARRMERDHSTIVNAVNRRLVYASLYGSLEPLVQALRSGGTGYYHFEPRPLHEEHDSELFWTEEVMQEVDRRMSAGETRADIAESMDRTHDALASARAKWLKQNPNRRIINRPRWPKETLSRAVSLRQSGWLIKDIAREINVPRATVADHLKRVGAQSLPR